MPYGATESVTPPPVNWDGFDSHAYFKLNYSALRKDDQRLIASLRDFFGAKALDNGSSREWVGIDVGSGTNLYPALAMLPLCRRIKLWEYGAKNRDWLRAEMANGYSTLWNPHWRVLQEHSAYAAFGGNARRPLSKAVEVVQGSVFDLPEEAFDVGTMFFVAESITDERQEFEAAVRSFLRSLRRGAPFAAAFMRNSTGYRVKDAFFPALRITEDDVEKCLAPIAGDLKIETVDTFGQLTSEYGSASRGRPLRPGYEGMILAYGILEEHPPR